MTAPVAPVPLVRGNETPIAPQTDTSSQFNNLLAQASFLANKDKLQELMPNTVDTTHDDLNREIIADDVRNYKDNRRKALLTLGWRALVSREQQRVREQWQTPKVYHEPMLQEYDLKRNTIQKYRQML